MFFGRNEENGLRCVYHGWKFDVDGRCVDMPKSPGGRLPQQGATGAYPAQEKGDFMWAYIGPPALEPVLPELEFALVPPEAPPRLEEAPGVQLGAGGPRAASTPRTSPSCTCR